MANMDWLRQLAPMIGTALAGPLGGAAAGFLADKLGVKDSTVEAVTEVLTNQKLSSEQIASLKAAEIDFQRFLETNKIDLAKLDVADRQGARDMLVATRSWVPAVISVIVVFGYFGILTGLMFGVLHVSDNQSLLILIGALSTAFGGVLNFWLGSSHGSQQKDEKLYRSQPIM